MRFDFTRPSWPHKWDETQIRLRKNTLFYLSLISIIRPLSGTSLFVKWHSAVHGFFVYNGDYNCVTKWISTCLNVSASWIPLNYLETEKKTAQVYLYGYCAYNQLQNKNHRCQCKQMHVNYFRITTTLCHLTAVLCGRLKPHGDLWYRASKNIVHVWFFGGPLNCGTVIVQFCHLPF